MHLMESHSRLMGLRPKLTNLNMPKVLHLKRSNMGHWSSLDSFQSIHVFRSSEVHVAHVAVSPGLALPLHASSCAYQDPGKAKHSSSPYLCVIFFALLGRYLSLVKTLGSQLKIVDMVFIVVAIAVVLTALFKDFKDFKDFGNLDEFSVYELEKDSILDTTTITFDELVAYAPKESGILFPRPFGTPFLNEGHLKSCLIASIDSLEHSAPAEFDVGYVDAHGNPFRFREKSQTVIKRGTYPYVRTYRTVWFRRISEGGFQQ